MVGERYHAFLFQATQPDFGKPCAVILERVFKRSSGGEESPPTPLDKGGEEAPAAFETGEKNPPSDALRRRPLDEGKESPPAPLDKGGEEAAPAMLSVDASVDKGEQNPPGPP